MDPRIIRDNWLFRDYFPILGFFTLSRLVVVRYGMLLVLVELRVAFMEQHATGVIEILSNNRWNLSIERPKLPFA